MNDIVLRVQDKFGRGPWRPGFSREWAEDRDERENLLPCFVQFGIDLTTKANPSLGRYFGCGCRTIEQLKRWFSANEYKTLLNLGYRAVRIDGTVIAESEIQVVLQRKIPLNERIDFVDLY